MSGAVINSWRGDARRVHRLRPEDVVPSPAQMLRAGAWISYP